MRTPNIESDAGQLAGVFGCLISLSYHDGYTYRPVCFSEQSRELLKHLLEIANIGLGIFGQPVVIIHILKDPLCICPRQEPYTCAKATQYQRDQHNPEDHAPSFFHSAGTSL